MSNNLEDIFQEDELGLLDVKPSNTQTTSEERLINSFLEIIDFVKENGREPEPRSDLQEHRLYKRLEGFRKSDEKRQKLFDFDELGLLANRLKDPQSLDEVLKAGEGMGLLEAEESDLFDFKSLPQSKAQPEYVAKRKPIEDFDQYEILFKNCHKKIQFGEFELKPFTNQHQIEAGRFFVERGLLVYVAEVKESQLVHGRYKNRLTCIYENGTQSNIFLRSLASNLYQGGKVVVDKNYTETGMFELNDEDREFGYVYILRSLSEDPQIKEIDDLFKIGFTSQKVEERIKNAANDPTYFMADVEIVESYKCFNMNPQKFENLLHKFFAEAKLDSEIINKKGFKTSSNEWFVVPFNVIDQAVQLIVNGEVVHYYYDIEDQKIKLTEE